MLSAAHCQLSITVEERVAVTIWKLATDVECCTLSALIFGKVNSWDACYRNLPCNSPLTCCPSVYKLHKLMDLRHAGTLSCIGF